MKLFKTLPVFMALFSFTSFAADFYSFKVKKADTTEQSLSDYKGKVVLVVNVASRCGFTPQYEGLEELYKKHSTDGFTIVGFPCNQFGSQEPGTDQEIQKFCKANYGVTFPVMAKIDVNGNNADPLYKWLKSQDKAGGREIKWNFSKFLVGRDGQVIKRYDSKVVPSALSNDIEKALAVK